MCAKTRDKTVVRHSLSPRALAVAACASIAAAILLAGEVGEPLASPGKNEKPTPQRVTSAEGSKEQTAPHVASEEDSKAPIQTAQSAPPATGAPEAAAPVPRLLAQDTAVKVEAYTGKPFGVAKITVDFPRDRRPTWYPDQCIQLSGRSVLYPAFKVAYMPATGEPRSMVDRYEGYFLFQGSEPFPVELKADKTYVATATPSEDRDARRTMTTAWWRYYKRQPRLFSAKYNTPQPVHEYLTGMLARRMDLSDSQHVESVMPPLVFQLLMKPVVDFLLPTPKKRPSRTSSNTFAGPQLRGNLVFDFDRFLGLLFGTESIRIAFQLDKTLADANRSEVADQFLPQSMTLPPVQLSGESYVAPIEAIAHHVPAECFYLRCRNVEEYLWLRNLVMSWGGSFNDLISTEAVDHQLRAKIERQLAFSPDTAMRDNVDYFISDMALIGTDILFLDGAALGVLFEAKEPAALNELIRRQRDETLHRVPGATEKKISFGENELRFLSTEDNRVRSYYAIHGKYSLLTTSSHVARRFFEIENGRDSLGALREFRYARTVMPLAREDAVFIYLSDPFFRFIVSPHYRIEMTRRAWAIRDWKQLYLARMAARAEGAEGGSVEALIESGFLPLDFLIRPDESRPVIRDGTIYDSLRGALGTFLPIPDVEVPKATRSEIVAYQRFAADYRRQWRRMDPVSIGIQHQSVGKNRRQRVTLDVRITPYARENYERLASLLDSPDQLQMVAVPGDVMSVEARLRSFGSYVPGVQARRPRAYAGMRDFPATFTLRNGEVRTVSLNPLALAGNDYPTYAGAKVSGNPWSDVRGDRHTKPGDPGGYSYADRRFSAILKYRRTWNEHWIAWAHNKEILEEVTPDLQLEPADRPAQVRFRLGDLAASDLAPAIHALCYMHARRISALNVRQMCHMMNQFQLPPAEARHVAEQLLQGQIICPLNGKYRIEDNGEAFRWQSTAWQRNSVFLEDRVPEGYCHPFLNWLRGARMEMSLGRITLSTHVELEVNPSDKSILLPLASHRVIPAEHVTASIDVPSSRPDSAAPSREPPDAIVIQGTWKVVKCQENGEPVPNTEGIVLRIEGNKIIQVLTDATRHEYEYRLHSESQPRGFDYLAKGRRIWSRCGLYQLDGDRLVICYGHQVDSRPVRLDANRDDIRRWLELERLPIRREN